MTSRDEAVQRWIPVGERLPKADEVVLAYWNPKKIETAAVGELGYWYWTQDGDQPQKPPTHWMPAPSSPTDKEEKGDA